MLYDNRKCDRYSVTNEITDGLSYQMKPIIITINVILLIEKSWDYMICSFDEKTGRTSTYIV